MRPAYRPDGSGLCLTVRVTPKASKTAFAGLVLLADGGQAVAVRVAAPPVDGAANEALIAFLGKQLDVRKSDVSLSSGETSRLKQIHVAGDAAVIAARLRDRLGG